jgi:hypothetical protein
MRIPFPVLVGLSLCNLSFGQADPKVAFEVATIRPSVPGGRGGGMVGGPGSSDPERFSFTNLSLLLAVGSAYGLRGDQLVAPDWLGSAQFDIFAKVPAGATREQGRRGSSFNRCFGICWRSDSIYKSTMRPGNFQRTIW